MTRTSANPSATGIDLPTDIPDTVTRALDEDIGTGDLTASLIDPKLVATANVICREEAILCGIPWFDEVFRQVHDLIEISWYFSDGDSISPSQIVCRVRGTATHLLSAERTALNFLQTLSGTATVTRQYATAVAPYGTRILDTRKTIPGLRNAQKYAVLVGGGVNHRIGLYDGVLIKENHQYISRPRDEMIGRLKQNSTNELLVEVEIECLDELESAIESGVTRVMLDNFSVNDIAAAVKQTNRRVELEASGNIDLNTIQAVARTGVDCISVGAITKNLYAIDFSMQFVGSNSDESRHLNRI